MPADAAPVPLTGQQHEIRSGRQRAVVVEVGGGVRAEHQTALNEPDKGNALHGFTWFANWTATDVRDDAVAMTLRLHGQQGYPFVLDLSVRYVLSDDGLTVTTRTRNAGAHPAPRTARTIGNVEMDYAFTDLERDGDGRAWLELRDPDTDRAVRVWVDESFGYLEIFTGDSLPQADRRRGGLGVEPMTCPPNGFGTGEEIKRLEPSEEFVCQWGIVPR